MEYIYQIYARVFGIGTPTQGRGYSYDAHKIVAFGNVLLDRTIELKDISLMDEFQLTLHSKGELDSETLTAIATKAGDSLKPDANPGGSALNTVRILKTLGTEATFFGAVGEDVHANQLKEILHRRNVDARLQVVDDMPTGMALCLVHEDSTALYANIGASAKFSIDYLKSIQHHESQSFLRPIERRQILYIESFFIPHREEVCDYILQQYIHGRRRLALNLSGSYIVKQKFQEVVRLAKEAYFVFGNEDEFQMLIEQLGCENVEGLAKELIQGDAVKIIIITKGADGVQLVSNYVDEYSGPGSLTYQCFHAPRVTNIVDTTGAGDSFVAGFLHAWLERRPLTECIRIGTEVAAMVITQIGCNLPEQ